MHLKAPIASKAPEKVAIVKIPTWEPHNRLQTVIGKSSPLSNDLEEYRGIPYGKFAARWEHSQVRDRLPRDIFDATSNGPKCPQPSEPNNSRTYQSFLPFPDDVIESEFDCLNLFIVRPSIAALERHGFAATTTRLPVLFWIHGGACAFGAGTDPMWNPARLVLRALHRQTPIIAVCINYRLNMFGFVGSTDLLQSQAPCSIQGLNFGLRDQKVAMEWTRRNIDSFGGDPDNITIGGQSAGSFSVHCHLLEAQSNRDEEPLFRRAIMQSGALGTLGPESLEQADKTWNSLCRLWSVDSETTANSRVELLRRLPASALVDSANELQLEGFPGIFDNITIFPTDTVVGGDIDVHLGPTSHRRRAVRQSPPPHINVLMGVTDWECSIFVPPSPVPWRQIKDAFEEAYAEQTLRDDIMRAYELVESTPEADLQRNIVRFLNDSIIEIPVHLAREALLRRRRRSGEGACEIVHSFHVEFGNPFPGPQQGIAHHCVELIYLFEAFHDSLAAADSGIVAPYRERPTGGKAADGPRPILDSDSGIDSPPEHDADFKDGDFTDGGSIYKRTNIELCHALQDHWLDYIIGDDSVLERSHDVVTVYGRDRGTSSQNLRLNSQWQVRIRRWNLAAQDLDAMALARKLLRGV